MGRTVIHHHLQAVQESNRYPYPSLEGFGQSAHLAYEISNESQEIDRLLQVVESLESLRQIAENIPAASFEHLALFETVINQARQNLSQHTDLLPALESFAGQRISTEGLVDRIIELVAYIRRLIGRLMEKIRGFFNVVRDDSTQLWARLGFARDVHKELQGRFPKREVVHLGQTAIMLTAKDGIPHDAKMLIRNINNLEKQLQSLRTRYIPLVQKTGQLLANAMVAPALQSGDFEGWLAGLNHAASAMTYGNLNPIVQPLSRMVDSRYAADSAWLSAPIPGDRAIVLIDGSKIQPSDHPSIADQAVAIQNTQMQLIRPNQGHRINLSEASMTTMPHLMIGTVLDQVAALLKELDQAATTNVRNDLAALDRQLEAVIRQIPDDKTRGVLIIQTGLAYGSAYSKWCSSPYLNLLSHTLSVAGAMISACGKHMAAY